MDKNSDKNSIQKEDKNVLEETDDDEQTIISLISCKINILSQQAAINNESIEQNAQVEPIKSKTFDPDPSDDNFPKLSSESSSAKANIKSEDSTKSLYLENINEMTGQKK